LNCGQKFELPRTLHSIQNRISAALSTSKKLITKRHVSTR
jgi:hypothetical protein